MCCLDVLSRSRFPGSEPTLTEGSGGPVGYLLSSECKGGGSRRPARETLSPEPPEGSLLLVTPVCQSCCASPGALPAGPGGKPLKQERSVVAFGSQRGEALGWLRASGSLVPGERWTQMVE